MKCQLQKFSSCVDGVGKIVRDHADQVSDGAQIINSETDIRLFIEKHRSYNQAP